MQRKICQSVELSSVSSYQGGSLLLVHNRDRKLLKREMGMKAQLFSGSDIAVRPDGIKQNQGLAEKDNWSCVEVIKHMGK